MAKKIFNKDEIFGNWKLIKEIGWGGNSSVWAVENISTNELLVIKLLKKEHETAKKRFIDEIKIISENQDILGVMKIFDNSAKTDNTYWYVMPKAKPLNKFLFDKPITVKVDAILNIAKILSRLHAKGVSHRDIKIQNLFFEDNFIIGDFGLVDYPEKEEGLTIAGNSLGPRWTIAPEMRNNPENSDGRLADVYSLSKTLWILLTGIEKGFEGQYSPSGSVGLQNHSADIYTNILEDLLVKSTENDPKLRPTIDEFVSTLSSWIEIQENFYKKNNLDWKTVQHKLFPFNMPEFAEWTDLQSICNILNILGGIKSLNHMFFDNGGGLDLEGAILSHEKGFLELNFGIVYLVQPKRLSFCSFKDADYEWNYFYLELEEVNHIFNSYKGSEQIIELDPLNYKPYDFVENYYEKYDNGENPPRNYRTLVRLNKGNCVIFRKTSSYNLTPSTYDGRHGKMTIIEFREYIQSLIDKGYKAGYIRDEEGKIINKFMTHDIRWP